LQKLGFDTDKLWAEFQAEIKEIKDGKKQYMSWEDADR
jgi:hypothetical protein